MEHEFVPVRKDLKFYVIGRGGSVVKEIKKISGATVFSQPRDTEGFTVSGNEGQRACAKRLILEKVAGGRIKEKDKEVKRLCYYIDEWNLSADCKLKLEKVVQEEKQEHRYRLKPTRVHAPQGDGIPNCDISYLAELRDDVLKTLYKIKNEMKTKTYLKADMWCHFGTVLIQPPTEGTEGEWDMKEAVEKLQARSGNHWRARFKGGVNVDEKLIEEHILDKTPEEYDDYSSRYDLTFEAPSGQQLSLKVWVTEEGKKAEDIPTPSSDVINILQKLHFKDEKTRSRCRGWLILPPRQYLRADILFPGCEFDCRLNIRERTENALHMDYAPKEYTIKVLSEYLSELTFADEDDFGLCLPKRDSPSGFHLCYQRCSKRALHGFTSDFSIILSKESSFAKHATTEETRVSTDFHLHCKEWDELLETGNWEPEVIVKKLPEFFHFVKKIQRCVIHEMDETGLAKTVPPEILARGRSALQAYAKALADGKTSVKMVPIMLIGQDRAGKTSLKKSLKGICFDPEENSTVGIDVDPSYFEVTTETWRTGMMDNDSSSNEAISFEYQTAKRMVGSLKKDGKSTKVAKDSIGERPNNHDSELSETSFAPSSSGPSGDDKSTQTTRDSAPKRGKEVPHRSPDQKQRKKKESDRVTLHVPEEVATTTETLLQSECEDNREDIYSTLWDFAGQSVYYETHPLFLTKRAIYCLVYNLGLNPSDKAKPVVKQGVYKKYPDSFNLKTNLDYLDFWMTSVASLASNQSDDQDVRPKSEVLPDKLPAVFLVCTHADKPYEDRDPIELAREIFGCLKSKPYGAHLHDFFVVDNTKSGTESECLEVVRLRKDVLAVAKDLPHINETIPIRWLKFDQAINALKQKGSKYISLEVAKDIASTGCNIKEGKEAKTLIDYLHDLRSLIHFDDSPELNKLVILDAQWLIDVFKKVITVRPYDCKEKKFEELWRKLQREGILDEELLTHVWGPLCTNNESRASFVRIMEKFSLLCPWPSETSKSFIVPSMLKTHPEDRVLDLVTQAKIPSLFIKFQNGSVPLGLFCRFVLQFFQWGKENFLRPEKPQFFRNFARFVTSGGEACSVIFVCHTSSVEVVIVAEDDHDTATFTCADVVCTQVGLMLESMRNEFHWLSNMRYEMSVLCPVCCQGAAIENCSSHDFERCNQEQCLHFWSLSELFSAKETVICTKSPFAQNIKVHTKDFTPWFPPSGHQLTVGERERNNHFPGNGQDQTALALPDNALESLSSPSHDPKQIVRQLTESIPKVKDLVVRGKQDTDAKAMIRCFARKAKHLNRLDVVEHLREKAPAGTTGPLLPEHLDVQKIPLQQLEDLTHILSGGDEWKRLAEKLGLTPDKIRYLDKRVMNPADAFLAYLAKQRHFIVGELYDALCECGFPLLADKL